MRGATSTIGEPVNAFWRAITATSSGPPLPDRWEVLPSLRCAGGRNCGVGQQPKACDGPRNEYVTGGGVGDTNGTGKVAHEVLSWRVPEPTNASWICPIRPPVFGSIKLKRLEPSWPSQPSDMLAMITSGSTIRPTPPNQPASTILRTAASVLSNSGLSIFLTSMIEIFARPPCWRNSAFTMDP